MDWITTHIAIGNYREANDPVLHHEHGFRSILSLDGSLTADDAERLGVAAVEAFRLIDGAGNDLRVIQLAIQALEELIASHPPVLVHCHAGRSRSVVIVAAYLARTMDLEPQRALACVKNKRAANVTPELLELLDQL